MDRSFQACASSCLKIAREVAAGLSTLNHSTSQLLLQLSVFRFQFSEILSTPQRINISTSSLTYACRGLSGSNAQQASIRFLNRFGGNSIDRCPSRFKHWAWSALTHGVFSPKEIEMKKLMFVLIASAVCSAFTINASAQQADQAISDAVIAMTKAQWAS